MISEYTYFPVTRGTFSGVPTAQPVGPESTLRVVNGNAVLTVTVTLSDESTVVFTPPSGASDYVLTGEAVSVTSTLIVIMS
jgi:hypothetical protein